MRVKTKGNANPKGKSRVLFTCHPDDWERSFERICRDIFKSSDPAIYFIDSDEDTKNEKLLVNDLRQMSLFVIPVSLKLLMEHSFAKDYVLPFAKRENIPILPVILEPGLEEIYSKRENFGSLQYLDLNSNDNTAVDYEKKLQDYLESTLVSNELAERVRKAFDAYVFLSYRKKDRYYVNELMRCIHEEPLCRDIAIWYDEFLVPGEAFDDAIADAMNKSELFILLVTPNLINEDNYVQSVEYPRALRSNLPILPVEVIDTDRKELENRFPYIPECIKRDEDKQFRDRFISGIHRIARAGNDSDPKHNYLIGLAYLNGIDVEVDRDRGVKLITSAAENGLPEAMKKLSSMYEDGLGVERSYPQYLKWLEAYVGKLRDVLPEDDKKLLNQQIMLSYGYYKNGKYIESLALRKHVLSIQRRVLGADHPNTISCLGDVASAYRSLGRYEKALETGEQVYESLKRVLGEDHPDTISGLAKVAYDYRFLGRYEEALRTDEHVYDAYKRVLGKDHPDTIKCLGNIAYDLCNLGEYGKALETSEQVYDAYKRVLGEDHPETIRSLGDIDSTLYWLGEYEKALEISKQKYKSQKRVLGEDHPDTISCLGAVAFDYRVLDRYEEALIIYEQVYEAYKRILGEDHPDTINSLSDIAYSHMELGEYEKALELSEQVYESLKRVLWKDHPDTINSLSFIADNLRCLGEYEKALEISEQVYDAYKRVLGEDHPDTIDSLYGIDTSLYNLGEYEKALETSTRMYESLKRVLGEEHPKTLSALGYMAFDHSSLNDYETALELSEYIYNVRRRVLGEDHPDTHASLDNMLNYRKHLQTQKEPVEHKEESELEIKTRDYENNRKEYGEDHPKTIHCMNELAMLLGDLKEYDRSLELKRGVYEARKRTLGQDHPLTELTLSNLERWTTQYEIIRNNCK